MLDLITFCKKIEHFLIYYKRMIKSYYNTAHNILKEEIDLYFLKYQGNKNVELSPH